MEIDAPSHWHCVDFISDLHLHESAPLTQQACAHYLQHTPADALFILGDLFEVWVGDDALQEADPFIARCVGMLHQVSQRLPVFIMAGNRDFLMGAQLMAACGASALPDPSVLVFNGQRWVLSHGDALCLDDHPYQAFRAQVRKPDWQAHFLSLPLAQRQALAREMRNRSETSKQVATRYVDLDNAACLDLMASLGAQQMIHGHTHQPASHALSPEAARTVLSDWDLAAQVPRADVIRLTRGQASQTTLQRLDLSKTAAPGATD